MKAPAAMPPPIAATLLDLFDRMSPLKKAQAGLNEAPLAVGSAASSSGGQRRSA
jgi:hypothetical protein